MYVYCILKAGVFNSIKNTFLRVENVYKINEKFDIMKNTDSIIR